MQKQIAQPSLDDKLTECEEKPLQQSDSETIEAITSIEIFTDNPTISEVTTVQSERPPRQNLILAKVDVNAGHGSITEVNHFCTLEKLLNNVSSFKIHIFEVLILEGVVCFFYFKYL